MEKLIYYRVPPFPGAQARVQPQEALVEPL
jgi:hypothetical protein